MAQNICLHIVLGPLTLLFLDNGAGGLYEKPCKREQDNYLKNFKEGMGIRHTSSDIVTGNSAYSGFYPAFSHKQNSCDYNRSHYIKQKMYHCRTLCIFVAADTCQQRCGTRADITA